MTTKKTRDRVLNHMEGRNSILIIDGRVFTNEIAGEILERFLTQLLNEVNVKIILITASDTSRAKPKRSTSEETTIYLGPLDLASTVKLYGKACPLISSAQGDNGFSNVDSFDEFESLLLPGSPASVIKDDVDSRNHERSHRKQELYDYMGGGNPKVIIQRASSCTTQELSGLLKIAQRPDVSVATSKELEEQRERWIAERTHAIENKYYLWAGDIEKTLQELEDLKKVYPSLDDMKAKESDLKNAFSELLKAKRYDDANLIKRKILVLKRTMMKEKFSTSSSNDKHTADALESINDIQERMNNMRVLAESMNASNLSLPSEEFLTTSREASFSISDGCTLQISCGAIASFWKDSSHTKNASMVVWTNEECDFSSHDETMQQLLGDAIGEKLASMKILTTTDWGPVRCATGESVVIKAHSGCIALAVPPLPQKVRPRNKDSKKEENLQFMETRLRSAIRSSLREIRLKNCASLEGEGTELVGISTTTSLYKNNPYRMDANEAEVEHRKRNLAVILNTIVEELRRGNSAGSLNSTKTTVRLFASSGLAKECAELIEIASEPKLAAA